MITGHPITITVEPLDDATEEYPFHGFIVSGDGETRYVGASTAHFDAFQTVCFEAAVRTIMRRAL